MTNEPTQSLDYHVLEELHQATGPSRAFMTEVAKLFRDEAEAFVLGVDNMAQIDRAATLHSLAGATRTVGMNEIARRALEGEQAFKENQSDADQVAFIKAALPDLIQLLEAWTSALPDD